jgi:hypothetical protein
MVVTSILFKWCADSNRKLSHSILVFLFVTLLRLCCEQQGLIQSVSYVAEASIVPTSGPTVNTVINDPSSIKNTGNNDNSTSLPSEQRNSWKANKPWSFWGRISGGDSDDDDESDTEIDDDTTTNYDSNITSNNNRPISIKTPVTVEIETVIHRTSDLDQSVVQDTISSSLKSSRIDEKNNTEKSHLSLWPPMNPVDWSAIETDAEMDDSASINELDWDKVEDIFDASPSKELVSHADIPNNINADPLKDKEKSVKHSESLNSLFANPNDSRKSTESDISTRRIVNLPNSITDDAAIIDELENFSRQQFKRQQHKFQQTQLLRRLARQLANGKTPLSPVTRHKLQEMMNGTRKLNLPEILQEMKSHSDMTPQPQHSKHPSHRSDSWLLNMKQLLQNCDDDETDDEGSAMLPINIDYDKTDVDAVRLTSRSSNREAQPPNYNHPTTFGSTSDVSFYDDRSKSIPLSGSDQLHHAQRSRHVQSSLRGEEWINPYRLDMLQQYPPGYYHPKTYRFRNEYATGIPQKNSYELPYTQSVPPYYSSPGIPYTNSSDQQFIGYESFSPYRHTQLNYPSLHPPTTNHYYHQLYGPRYTPLTEQYLESKSELYDNDEAYRPSSLRVNSRTAMVPPAIHQKKYFSNQRYHPLVASSEVAKELQRYRQPNHDLAQNNVSPNTPSTMSELVPLQFQEAMSIANVSEMNYPRDSLRVAPYAHFCFSFPNLPDKIPQTFAEASANASIGSLAKISILCFTIALLCYSAVSPRTIPLTEYNLRFFENIRNLALAFVGPAAIFFSISEAEQNPDVNPIINTFFVSFTIGYILTFCMEVFATTGIRLAVFGWLEPTVFRQLIPKVPLCILPWVLQDNHYRPKRVTIFVADLIANCVAAPVIEEYSKLLLLQSATNLPRYVFVFIPANSCPLSDFSNYSRCSTVEISIGYRKQRCQNEERNGRDLCPNLSPEDQANQT